MERLYKTLFLIIVIIALCTLLFGTDMVILNGKIFTVDPNEPYAEALAIQGNIIAAVGKTADIEKLVTPATTVIDAKSRLVTPGFNDAHLHFISGGQSLLELDLAGCRRSEDIQKKLRVVAECTPVGAWITGRGWDHTLFNNGQWPVKEMLDVVIPDHPVFLRRIDGHVGWANSYALRLAGISSETPNPEGGEIVRDALTFGATGILKETAMQMVAEIIPANSTEQKERALDKALKDAARLGVTSIQDNSGIETIELYQKRFLSGQLTVRVSEWLDFDVAQTPEKLRQTYEYYSAYTEPDMLRLGLVKGFVDGTLGSRTAYFFTPYADNPATVGLPQYTQEELEKLAFAADSLNMQIGLHCIGDKANWMALTAYEKARDQNNRKDLRHRIEHTQVLRLEDIPKLAQLGVVASMQPTHCTSDLRWAEQRIGHERCKGAYAWRKILLAGGVIAFGTDWPVEPLDPMRGLYSAVTRKNIESGEPANGWFADQCLTIEEAIYCYTMASAYAEHQEKRKGSITPGKLADIIILSNDVLTCQPKDILSTKVDMTIFNGNIIYTRPGI
ncbi:amidohydrolase [candidate division KSB1 bacterium]|nr:amidohydrolase [candidate division KSB1 bacterium]RQW00606.1 MAG: amidohydrolase [candidate division KSB1 bacterium]